MGEHRPIETILGQIRGERGEGVRVPALPGVVIDVEELDAPEAEQPRAVRVSLAVGEGVVLAMNGDPLLSALSGGQPQNGAKDDVGDRVETGDTVAKRQAEALVVRALAPTPPPA